MMARVGAVSGTALRYEVTRLDLQWASLITAISDCGTLEAAEYLGFGR
jgi:hypothetical protein